MRFVYEKYWNISYDSSYESERERARETEEYWVWLVGIYGLHEWKMPSSEKK